MAKKASKYSRRTIALFWCGVVAVVIAALIYFEQIPILYALATIALVVLLLVVSFANLEQVGNDNDAAFGDGNG
ncbi:MAG: hypothetical protein R2684_10540 [Pyrinomonadaceae bacterium]